MPRPFYPKDSKATTVLVLGILSIVLCGFLSGVPAWIIGSTELKNIKIGITDPSDKVIAQTGVVLGIIGTLFSVLWLALALAGIDVWFF